jgi:hypothetical protein
LRDCRQQFSGPVTKPPRRCVLSHQHALQRLENGRSSYHSCVSWQKCKTRSARRTYPALQTGKSTTFRIFPNCCQSGTRPSPLTTDPSISSSSHHQHPVHQLTSFLRRSLTSLSSAGQGIYTMLDQSSTQPHTINQGSHAPARSLRGSGIIEPLSDPSFYLGK